jgi:hypothetical protein
MIIIYCSYSKNTLNFKFYLKKFQKYIFKIQKNSITYKWDITCMTYIKTFLIYDLKINKISTLIQNYDKFSKWNTKFDKIYTFFLNHIYWTMNNRKHCDLLK